MLSQQALMGLEAYKYRAGGYTKLDDLHQPFWNAIINFFPMWLAPNLVTLTGMMFLLAAYGANALYLWTQGAVDAPR